MSTKTTLKRVALVAVSALGFGLLSMVPSQARTATTTVTIGTPTVNAVVVGQSSTISVPLTITAMAASDTFTVSAVLSAQPVGGTMTTDDIAAVDTDVANFGGNSTADISSTPNNSTVSSNDFAMAAGLSGTFVAGTTTQYFTFTPALAGTYTIAVFLDGAANVTATGAIKGTDTVRYVSLVAIAAPAATAFIDQPIAGSIATDGTGRTNGAVLRVRVKDSAGNFTRLNGAQQVLVNLPSGVTVSKKNGSSVTATTQYGLVASDFNSSGAAFLNVTAATAGTYPITAQISGDNTLSTVSVTYVLPTGVCAAGSGATNPDATSAGAIKAKVSGAKYSSVSGATISRTQTSTTVTCFGAATEKKIMITVSDLSNYGMVFGYTSANLAQDLVATTAVTAALSTATDGSASSFPATVTIAHSGLTVSPTAQDTYRTFKVSPQDTSVTTAPSALDMTVTGALADASSTTNGASIDTALPTSTYLVVNGGTVSIKAGFYDQFGGVATGAAVTAQVTAGRNLQATATNLITDASGEVTFTLTDANSTSATTSDTVTFSYGSLTATVTVNYTSAIAATTMTLVPSATTTTAINPADFGAIVTSTATASTSTNRDTVSATLLDANGAPLVGAPVTLTVPAGVTLYSLSNNPGYTNSSGVVSWSVYTTTAGTYAFTATGAGLTKTGYAKWSGGSARVVKVTAGKTVGDVTPIKVKVEDAYGNGVGSTAISLSTSGGYFQGIPLTSSQNTDANGEINVALVGSGTVTASGTASQMFDGAALIGTTAATGFPAGVNTASVTVTAQASASQAAADAAADAAAEAIDAANAATDAANLAAEAADAATVAAEEARDAADAATAAVEELATQVATLMAALKAQITTLANTVAKIAKKVKA